MLRVKLIAVGSVKEKYFTMAIDEYKKRLSRFVRLELIEVGEELLKDESVAAIEQCKVKESERLLSRVDGDDLVVLLDRQGEEMDSCSFASFLDTSMLKTSTISFLIGGSYGTSEIVSKRANVRWSFGALTFPHTLMRVMMLEQLYRGFKILRHETYHK